MVIHIYTGTGKGKTTAALGLSLRAVGHKMKVIIVQFMKGWKTTGEYVIQKKLAPYFHLYQFGRKGFVNLQHPSKKDIALARKAFEFAKENLAKADVLVLDEIDVAVRFELLPASEVVEFMKKVPKGKWVVFTGRYAMPELYKYADYVTEFKDLKRPQEKMRARKGIEY
ncbi:MAG: cob(I)yrinic acid a,c-diamide adenosyltransferase [Candidatus Nanoarchaeia archaeon]|nr:cob(I)yrinic acid a,c-diamide adenosyltransferase [Candidatus Nanoarchaeia archaeon]MDD5239440.1 cob(I)yrinic acid a,c-diamide adenosyltransferase [Candidatus Nanoarchaeia archaeon]